MRIYEGAAEALQELMEAGALDASSLSAATKIDAGILRQILSGRRKSISTRNILALSRFFGLSMQEMMDKLADTEDKGE